MSIPVALRSDYDAVRLRQLARQSKDAPQTRRLLALAVIYEDGSRTQAAAIGGVSLQTVRDWVLRFNAHGPDGLLDGKAPGQPSILSLVPCREPILFKVLKPDSYRQPELMVYV